MSYYVNITGNTKVQLLDKNSNYGSNIKSIILANTHATDAVSVDLYIYGSEGSGQYVDDSGTLVGGPPEDPTNTFLETVTQGPQNWNITETTYTYYIIKSLSIPVNATLVLEENEVMFNNNIYSMYIKLSASDSSVDVIVNGEQTEDFKNYNQGN